MVNSIHNTTITTQDCQHLQSKNEGGTSNKLKETEENSCDLKDCNSPFCHNSKTTSGNNSNQSDSFYSKYFNKKNLFAIVSGVCVNLLIESISIMILGYVFSRYSQIFKYAVIDKTKN